MVVKQFFRGIAVEALLQIGYVIAVWYRFCGSPNFRFVDFTFNTVCCAADCLGVIWSSLTGN